MCHLRDRLLVEPPPPQDLASLRLPNEFVLMEMSVRERLGLADVVQEPRETEDEVVRRGRVGGRDRVLEDILRDGLVLRDRLRDLELGKDDREEPKVAQHSERDRRLRGREDLDHLLLDALA